MGRSGAARSRMEARCGPLETMSETKGFRAQLRRTNSRLKPLTGLRFGRLTVIGRAGSYRYPNGYSEPMWRCRCDCGNEVEVKGRCLRSGDTTSCNCFRIERAVEATATHRQTKTRLYRAWCNMHRRCTDPGHAGYNDYGGRGIRVCVRWDVAFEHFRDDLAHLLTDGDIPKGMSIDRIDVNGNYEPGNVRLATRGQQNRNKRSNRWFTWHGRTLCVSDWAAELGVARDTVQSRLDRGVAPDGSSIVRPESSRRKR